MQILWLHLWPTESTTLEVEFYKLFHQALQVSLIHANFWEPLL